MILSSPDESYVERFYRHPSAPSFFSSTTVPPSLFLFRIALDLLPHPFLFLFEATSHLFAAFAAEHGHHERSNATPANGQPFRALCILRAGREPQKKLLDQCGKSQHRRRTIRPTAVLANVQTPQWYASAKWILARR